MSVAVVVRREVRLGQVTWPVCVHTNHYFSFRAVVKAILAITRLHSPTVNCSHRTKCAEKSQHEEAQRRRGIINVVMYIREVGR